MADQEEALPGKFDQALLVLRSLYGGLGEEETADLEESTFEEPGQTGTRMALNIDPQADRMKVALANLVSGAGRGIKSVGKGALETGKIVGKSVGAGVNQLFNPAAPGQPGAYDPQGRSGARRNALNVLLPSIFGATNTAGVVMNPQPSPEVQAILDAADEATAGF